MDSIWAFAIDDDGIYFLLGKKAGRLDEIRLLFISFTGTRYISDIILVSRFKSVYSHLVTNKESVFINVAETIYQFDKSTWNGEIIGNVKAQPHRIFPYLEGVVAQNGQNIEYMTKGQREVIGYLEKKMDFAGWYDVGDRVLVYKDRGTYILNLNNGDLQKFHGFPLLNYGTYKNTVMLYMMPRGGGGATMLDWELSDTWLLGNDVFEVYRVGLYDKNTGRIRNLPFSLRDANSLLPMDYDRKKFEKIKKILENPEHNISAE